ncbi:MAG: helix-turn-helix domain-containing protein [Myxococcota bacterium]
MKRGRPEGVLLDGELIRDRRTDLGLSQSAAAELARLGARTVRAAENGEPVSPDTAKMLASALGLAYLEVVKPSPRLVRERLEASGLAPVRPRDAWFPVEGESELHDAVLDPDVPVVCVEGPDGIGKSTLVRRVVEQVESRFPDGVVWVASGRLATREQLTRVRTEIAEALGFAGRMPDPALVSPEAFDQAFSLHFWRGRRMLVLDGLAEPDDLAAFTEGAATCVVVTTSRRWVADLLPGDRIALLPWDRDAIVQLLHSVAGAARFERDPEGTEAVLGLVGGLPLYARLAATGLQRARHRTLGDYVAHVRAALVAPQDALADPRDPVIRGLLDGVERTLTPEALQAVRDLALAGPGHFAERFAVAILGQPPARARAVLDELADAYLLRPVQTAMEEERLQLAAWATGAFGVPSAEAVTRMLRAGEGLLEALLRDDPRDSFEQLVATTRGLRANFDAVLHHLPAVVDAAPTPADLPAAPEPWLPGMERLPHILLSTVPLFRFAPPPEGGRWLTGGLVVARRTGDRDTEAQLAWLLGWWWLLRGEDPDAACAWADAAADLARGGPPDRAVSIAVHAAFLKVARRGYGHASPAFRSALELARTVPCSRAQLCSALLHAAGAAVFGRSAGSPPDWAAALSCLEEAEASCASPETPQERVLVRVARVNGAVARRALQREVDVQAVDEALAAVAAVLGDELFVVASARALVERLGGTPGFSMPDPVAALLQLEPHEGEAALQHLVELAGLLGAPEVGRPDDTVHDPELGHLGSWMVSGFPLGDRPGASVPLFLPLEPVRALLTGPSRASALRFVAAIRSPGHPAWRAIDGLSAPWGIQPRA